MGKVLSADKMTIQTLCKQDYGAKVMEFRHDGKLIGQNAYGRFGSIQLLENRNQAIRRFSAYP